MGDVIRVGLLGCGNVGVALVRLMHENGALIEARAGVGIEVTRVAVRDAERARDVDLAADVFTTDPRTVVASEGVDVVVEVMGGIDPARELISEALRAGKPV